MITGPSNLYQQTNNVLVIAALIVLLTEPMRGHAADRDFIVARRGLLVFAGFALWDNVISGQARNQNLHLGMLIHFHGAKR